MTGFQLQNLRKSLEDPDEPGTYRWDYLDGYEGDEKNSLDKHPDLQEKVRRVIIQGHIDEEDWNGVCDSCAITHVILHKIGSRDE